jgi:hypothetical protein
MQAAASAANIELVASAGDRGEATLEARMPLGVIVFAMTKSDKQTLLGACTISRLQPLRSG